MLTCELQVLDEEGKGYLEQEQLMRFMTTLGEKFSADEVRFTAQTQQESEQQTTS